VPFSDLFNHGFDPATLDATTQLADRTIFVTSNGRRYRFESIEDDPLPLPIPVPAQGRVPTSGPTPPTAARSVPVHWPGPAVSELSAEPPPPRLHVHAPDSAYTGWGRSPSNASGQSHSSGAYSARSGYAGAAVPGPEPRGSPHDVTSMMAHLNISRFGATPLYGESDGGVQAAETLTDPDMAPRGSLSAMSPGMSASPRISYAQQHQQPPPPPPPPSHYQTAAWAPHDYPSPGAASQYWSNVNYISYTAQTNAHLQTAQQRAVMSTGLPSLMEGSTPMMMPPHRSSDPVSTLSPISPEKEVWDGQGSGNGGGYHYHPLHASISAPPSFVGRQSNQHLGPVPADIDTLTPVVVHQPAPSTLSDGASTGRDNVLPGEDLLFDG
jgi:hypothetical protein